MSKENRNNAISISMVDLVMHPWFAKLQQEPNGTQALLYSMGLDIKLPFESTVCEHRSDFTDKIHTCERFSGTERKDEQWLYIKTMIQ